MNRLHLILIIVISISCRYNRGVAPPRDEDTISKSEVNEVMRKWIASMHDNDPVLLGNVLHKTWIYAGSDDGSTSGKEQTLTGMKVGEGNLVDIFLTDTLIRLYDDVAIVTGIEDLIFRNGQGDTSSVTLRFTDVYCKKDGLVQAISTHSSPVKS